MDDAINAQRYLWLRDRKSYYKGSCAPYVVDTRRSRLYAMQALIENGLDVSIDIDMIHSTAQRLHESNEIVERGLMPEGCSRNDLHDGGYQDALYDLTKKELGFTDARWDAAMLADSQ